MVDAYRRLSPLAHRSLEARASEDADVKDAGVTLEQVTFRGMVNVRGDASDKAFTDAFEKTVKQPVPTTPNTVNGKSSATHAAWLGPDEWWVITRPGGNERMMKALKTGFKDLHTSVTDVSENRTCIRVSGPNARDVMQKSCALDFHPDVFGAGQCAQTLLAKCTVMVHLTSVAKNGAPTYEIYVLKSFADYLWAWLEDASAEYGVKVAA